MSYQEWRRRQGWSGQPWSDVFFRIIDRSWTPEEQNELARLWKAWAPGE